MMKRRIISVFLAAITAFTSFSGCFLSVFANNGTITIATKEDFFEFAKNCTLDTWSQDKTVSLVSDIDFSDSSFIPVPTFCGTFNGNGHTLSGISYGKKGSYIGIFRYIEKNGKVSNLTVKARFSVSGSKSFLGGICGENSGTIENCVFSGNIKGENVIGGIAGNNTEYGCIVSCSSFGNIIGENSTGGICGKNSGFVTDCKNSSSVNTLYEERKTDISALETDTAAIIENYKNSKEENSEESVLGHTDTGGISGYSSGIIQGCVNYGTIGYKHIGYNVGGICGRQSGYVLGCQNYGFIQGRKDVGGICGQAEPYIVLNASENTLNELREELNSLNSMVNKLISDTDSLGNDTKKHLDNISKYSKIARNDAENLINIGTDFADDNLGQLNTLSARVTNTLKSLEPVFDTLEESSNELERSLSSLSKSIESLDSLVSDLSDDIDDIAEAMNRISKSETSFRKAVSKAKLAVKNLEEAVRFKDSSAVQQAVSELSSALDEIISQKQSTKYALQEIEKILSSKPESFETLKINVKGVIKNLNTIKANTETIVSSLKTIKNSLKVLAENTEIDLSKFKTAAKNMTLAIEYLADAMHYIAGGLEDLGDALSSLAYKFEKNTSEITGELSDSLDYLSYAADDITEALQSMNKIISGLANDEPIEFVKLGDDFRNSSDSFFDSLSGISDEMNGIKEIVSRETDKISADLTSVSTQFTHVMNLLIDSVERIDNGSDSLSDIFTDVSDEEITSARLGKIEMCQNSGKVSADRNTGGIAGNMAVEYSKDPEDDENRPSLFNFSYRIKAILHNCINEGEIIGKKDCTGGIVGLSEIGTVFECENYGSIESTNGNYVGGIAGKSSSVIRKCYAKGKLSGKRFIGGIAGKSETVTSSYTIVSLSGDENIGAVSGEGNKDNTLGNFYIDNGFGALDGISYKDHCEAISFEVLSSKPNIPPRFISFAVSFIADGKVVKTQSIKYGDDTKRIVFPSVPKKSGHFGKWQKIVAETVSEDITVLCEYQPFITIISSSEKNSGGKLSLALAEGEFTDEAVLHATNGNVKPPAGSGNNFRIYDLSLENTDIKKNEPIRFRILNENKDRATVWQLKNGKWEKLKTQSNGKYTIVSLNGTENTVCIRFDKSYARILYILLTLLAVGGISAIIILKKRKKQTFKTLT